MMTDRDILIGLEKIFKSKSVLSSKGLCYALWQGFKPNNEQNKRIIELLADYAETPKAKEYMAHSYWWPSGHLKERLTTVQRALKTL